jgi:hypothetical protein
MPRYPIREARGLLDKVLVAPQAAPVAGGRPGARGQSSQGQVGEQAQAVAGELLPRASRSQERWLDLVAGRRTC